MAGQRIAELALRPRVVEFIDAALSQGELAFSMEEVEVGAGGPLDRRTVGALRADGIFTLAIVRGPGAYDPNPPDERVLGRRRDADRVRLRRDPAPVARARLRPATAAGRTAPGRSRPAG